MLALGKDKHRLENLTLPEWWVVGGGVEQAHPGLTAGQNGSQASSFTMNQPEGSSHLHGPYPSKLPTCTLEGFFEEVVASQ